MDVVIVNWNTGSLLGECLASLAQPDRSRVDFGCIAVVDNASTDGSADRIIWATKDLPVTVIHNTENRGFAAACNQGAQDGKSDYLLFLNPDTRLTKGALEEAVGVLVASPTIGICGVRMIGDDGRDTVAAARFPSAGLFLGDALGLSRLRFTKPHLYRTRELQQDRQVDQVIGAFFLTRREMYDHLVGFDERFFVYFEEVDFALRARQAGFSSWYLHREHIYHRGGGSTGQVKARRLFYSLRSRFLYAGKHFGFPARLLLGFSTLFIEPFTRIIAAMLGFSATSGLQVAKGYALLWRWLLTGKPDR